MCHHLGTSPTSTCHSQPHSAALLIYSLALQHSSKRSSQPILQESVKFTCGIHQLSAYIPMSFHICEYSLSRGVAPNPPLWDNWAQAYSAFCSSSVQMDMFLFPPLFTDTASLLKEMYFSDTEEILRPQQKWSEVKEMKQASEGNFGFYVVFLLKYFSNKANICLPLCTELLKSVIHLSCLHAFPPLILKLSTRHHIRAWMLKICSMSLSYHKISWLLSDLMSSYMTICIICSLHIGTQRDMSSRATVLISYKAAFQILTFHILSYWLC